MAATVEDILKQLGTLSQADRLRVVEQVVHEMAAEATLGHGTAHTAIWADESESDFQAFQSTLQRLRVADVERTDSAVPESTT